MSNEMQNSQTKQFPVITIDGPAGSGKGTISQRVAETLGWHILDSGALYRLVALATLQKRISLDKNIASEEVETSESKVIEIARNLDVEFLPDDLGNVKIMLDGKDVTQAIRAEECGNTASKIATFKLVRTALLKRQQQFSKEPGLVADGRDMGTIVFPDAPVKIFLTASAEIRGERRLNQLKEQGISANLRGLIRDIEERDARDMQRKDAPLVPADDAIIIDTGKLSIDEVVDTVLKASGNIRLNQ